MSYILDALKKSEQDRGNGSIPNVQTIHSSSLNYHHEKRPIWPWLLIAALIINVAILVYFFKPDSNTKSLTTSSDVPVENITPIVQQNNNAINNSAPAITTEITTPITSTEAAEQTISVADNLIINTEPGTIATSASQAPAPVVDIDELPANIRRQIPDMVFSAHVYSSAPMQRSLVINNRFMEEGHAVSRDLTLIEITPNGAVFDFDGYRFSTGILSGWSTH